MPPPTTTSKVVLRSLYRSLLRAAAPFSPPSPSAAAYASLIHRSGVAHDWAECVHRLDSRRRVGASHEKSDKDKKNGKENVIPKSWAQNLSRSYSDLQEEYESRKEYFEQRYGAEYDDDGDDWDDDEAAMDLAMGSSSYYKHDEDYDIEEDPKFVLFRHLLREWFADGGTGDRINHSGEKSTKWPRQWSPDEEGYYENGRIKQVPLMRFPSQILNGNGLSLREIIQREFRAPSVLERLSMESKTKEEGAPNTTPNEKPLHKEIYPPSSFIDNEIRVQTSFYTLMELNRKLAWAEQIGFPASSQQATEHVRKGKRMVQAAKGVTLTFPSIVERKESADSANKTSSPLQCGNEDAQKETADSGNIIDDSVSKSDDDIRETTSFPDNEPKETTDSVNISDSGGNDDSGGKPDDDNIERTTSSPLQCGTYLIAHPLMTGYFAKSVIVLVDHTEEAGNINLAKTEEGGSSGGTYGLIINRLALQPQMVDSSRQQWELLRRNWEEKKSQMEEEPGNTFQSSSSHSDSTSSEESMADLASSDATPSTTSKSTSQTILRPISLLQAINADDLPETVQMAFGDSPVRDGGPVNLSLQMIHRKAEMKHVNMKEESDKKDDGDNATTEEEESEKKESSASRIGGTRLGSAHVKPQESEDAIYFGGDIIKASYAVLDGGSDRDDFSFIVGAACWAPGQLDHEIERGCWLPFRGPPQMAMDGECEHNEVTVPSSSENDDGTGSKGTKLSLFPPRPSNAATSSVAGSASKAASQQFGPPVTRPVGDLWLSILCALGDDEAVLAYMMLDSKNMTDKFGDACDNFDR